jgi:hypothetical protein
MAGSSSAAAMTWRAATSPLAVDDVDGAGWVGVAAWRYVCGVAVSKRRGR